MSGVFIYWDNSNVFYEAQRLAEELNGDPSARYRVRIHFENLFRLAQADRSLEKAYAAGSIPPEMNQLWNRLENQDVEVYLFDRGVSGGGEQETPDQWLQLRMMEDGWDNIDNPGVVALLTGDGAGYVEGRGFHSTLERLYKRGWKIEVLSWKHCCNRGMRTWAENNGVFVALDDYYESITFLEPSRPGYPFALPSDVSVLDLSQRPMVEKGEI